MKNDNTVFFKPLQGRVIHLLESQRAGWDLCGANYRNLSAVKYRDFQFENCKIAVQWNPGRMTSTSAKVDAKSITERKCFLCKNNRPAEQEEIAYKDEYFILVNPFPIFPEHYTITQQHHIPQEILPHFQSMLHLSRSLGGHFVLFYNGPKCGASAPDHMHFQAGNRGYLPIESELSSLLHLDHTGLTSGTTTLRFIDDGLRKFVLLHGMRDTDLCDSFSLVMNSLSRLRGTNEEPMVNILSFYNPEDYHNTVVVFLREKHRPEVYFREDDSRLLLSPAAVDIGGMCVTPREEDFRKISAGHLKQIFTEVFVSKEFFAGLENEVTALL